MNTMEIADRLVELCRQGKNVDALNTLYSADAGPARWRRRPPVRLCAWMAA